MAGAGFRARSMRREAQRRGQRRLLVTGLNQAHQILHGSFWTRVKWAVFQPFYRWRAAQVRRRLSSLRGEKR